MFIKKSETTTQFFDQFRNIEDKSIIAQVALFRFHTYFRTYIITYNRTTPLRERFKYI